MTACGAADLPTATLTINGHKIVAEIATTQDQLDYLRFPLGDLPKPQVRAMAAFLKKSADFAPDDAIRQVNSTAYGLSSGLCTQRLDVIMRFVKELHVGSVNVWEVPGYRLEVTPFGGIKDSGTGIKEGVQECCKAFTNVKTYSLPW